MRSYESICTLSRLRRLQSCTTSATYALLQVSTTHTGTYPSGHTASMALIVKLKITEKQQFQKGDSSRQNHILNKNEEPPAEIRYSKLVRRGRLYSLTTVISRW